MPEGILGRIPAAILGKILVKSPWEIARSIFEEIPVIPAEIFWGIFRVNLKDIP